MRFKLQWGWIYTRYRPQVWWWEAKVILQKLLTSTVVTVYAEQPERAVASLTISNLFYLLPATLPAVRYDRGKLLRCCVDVIRSVQPAAFWQKRGGVELILIAVNAVPVVMLLLVIKQVKLNTVLEKLRTATDRFLAAIHTNRDIVAAMLLMSIVAVVSVVLASQSTEQCVEPILAIVATVSVLALTIPGVPI